MDQSQISPAGERHWQASTVMDAAALENLHALNRLYLDVLIRITASESGVDCGPGSTGECAQSSRIAACVRHLAPVQRQALAASPFSLFDARFGDGPFWVQRVGAATDAQFREAGAAPSTAGSFTQLALFYAWHLVRADALAARLLLGMSDAVSTVFTALALPDLQLLAGAAPHLITPRWPERDTVWRILLGAARRHAQCMADTRLFGIQVMAGDLAGRRPAGAVRPGAL